MSYPPSLSGDQLVSISAIIADPKAFKEFMECLGNAIKDYMTEAMGRDLAIATAKECVRKLDLPEDQREALKSQVDISFYEG